MKGGPTPAVVPCWATRAGPSSKLKASLPQRKIGVTSKTPVGVVSVVTLIRTDTTLDHSQKAEKVCSCCVQQLYTNIATHARVLPGITVAFRFPLIL